MANILDNLCPYCSDELEVERQETAAYGVLYYGTCYNCRQEFVRYENELEWAEAAENWFDFYDDFMDYLAFSQKGGNHGRVQSC